MKFSIIMATMNSARFLERALNSVLAQGHAGYEIIVQDGGSKDATLPLLERYKRRVNVASEPDSGIFDAWNKALKRTSGDWAIFLGGDDFLINSDVLAAAAAGLAALPEHIDFAYGSLALGRDGRVKTRISNSLSSMYSQFFRGIGLPFPSTFCRLNSLRPDGFDPEFRIAGDFDMVARRLTANNIARLPHYVSFMEHGGLSNNPAHAARLHEERTTVIKRHIIPKAELIARCCLAHLTEDGAEDEYASGGQRG